MLLSLLYQTVLGSFGLPNAMGALVLDATLEESHEFGARVTEFPIEGGAIITDHVALQPRTLTLQGFVTDTPLALANFSLGRSRTASSYFLLEEMWRARIPFAVVSRLKLYENMVIESLVIPKDKEGALRFTCTMKQLTFVSGQNVAIGGGKNGSGSGKLAGNNVARPQDALGTDGGRQAAPEASPEAAGEASSILYRIFN